MKYKLYDLDIYTAGDPETFNCSHKAGEGLAVRGENIMMINGTKYFSHYVLASLMPYIAAKQRTEQKEDWMYYENEIACPDPKCGAIFVFKRLAKSNHTY